MCRSGDLYIFQAEGSIINQLTSSMRFKFCFGSQIHLVNVVEKLTGDFVRQRLATLFKVLPKNYSLSYLDEDGDQIALNSQLDFEILSKCNSAKAVKILIKEINEDFMEQTDQFIIEDLEEKPEVREPLKPEIQVMEEESVQEQTFVVEDSMIEEKLKTMLPAIISKIKSEVQEELIERSRISQKSEQKAQKMEEERLPKNSSQPLVVHTGVTCDGCQFRDIQGVRYKCSVCSNFDFCGTCQAATDHPHPFLKIKTLKQTPIKIFAVINDENDEETSFSVNGDRVNAPKGFEGLIGQGVQLLKGFFNNQGSEQMKSKCQQMKNEWSKHREQWRNQCCPKSRESKCEEKMKEPQNVKVQKKKEAPIEVSITENARYIQEVFGCEYEKCLLWSHKYPGVTKEELLNACIENPDFFN